MRAFRVGAIAVFVCLCFPVLLFAKNESESSESSRIVRSSLRYLEDRQTGSGDHDYDVGQWTCQVTSTFPSFIGVGKNGVPFEEPSAFVAGTVANVLAEMYFQDPSLDRIPPMVKKATRGLDVYRWDSVFHFYPPKTYKGLPSRGPRRMFLKPRFLGFANTPPDADTTSVSYLTLAYQNAIEHRRSPTTLRYDLPERALDTFVRFRDVNRSSHLFNQMHGDVDTGAFMTWFYDENDPEMPRKYLARPDQGTRIPFNKNDVDCVVNANILKLLTIARETRAPGYAEACDHLNRIIQKSGSYSCGMYYPSRWELPYTMATAIQMGASCLEPSRDRILRTTLRKQISDGSFKNVWKARPDFVQSTAWAVNTMLLLGNPADPEHRKAVTRGLGFLRRQVRQDSKGHLYWAGEVFFAATFVARYNVVWRSDAYTTALVARALQRAELEWGLSSF